MGKISERLEDYQTQMSIYAEQHKIILASDVLDMIEQLQDDLKDDIEKAVAELEKLPNREADYYYANSNDVIDREDAIEIVKQGGVSDDVCEYKIKDKVIYASCNNKQIASAFCWFNECGDYKYCPYCGKKIKEMESD